MGTPPDRPARLDRHHVSGARCVVTGGLGFIGSNLVHRLAAAGARVVVVDALVPTHGGELHNLDDIAGDAVEDVVLADIGDDEVAAAVSGAEIVFNVAGQVSHAASMTDPVRDLDLNVRSHLRFLETLRRAAPRAIVVQTSTRQVYGRPQYLPVDELHPTVPVDVNGIDKLACEQLHLLYTRVHGLPTVAVRLTNVYGPRQHLGREGLGFLPVFIRRALAGEDITVFGDGSQQRDCVHVDDVLDALLLAATAPAAIGHVFNLGHRDALSLLEIATLTQVAAARGGDVRCVPWPDELVAIDIGSFQGSYAKIERLLGWTPQISFADGIASTIAAFRHEP